MYHFAAGAGLMVLGDETFAVKPGDTVYFPPGAPHRVQNTGATALKILCCSTPPYADDDTELID